MINYRITDITTHKTTISSSLANHVRILRCATLAAASFCALATAAALLSLGGWDAGLVSATLERGALPIRWAAITAVILALLTCAALVELDRMLRHVGRGELFSSGSTKHFRRFALLFLAVAIVRAFLPSAVILALSFASEQPSVALSFDMTDVLMLLLAATFYFVAKLFDEAARLEDDSRSII